MKCDKCIWLIEENEMKAYCPLAQCVKENRWKSDLDAGATNNSKHPLAQ